MLIICIAVPRAVAVFALDDGVFYVVTKSEVVTHLVRVGIDDVNAACIQDAISACFVAVEHVPLDEKKRGIGTN